MRPDYLWKKSRVSSILKRPPKENGRHFRWNKPMAPLAFLLGFLYLFTMNVDLYGQAEMGNCLDPLTPDPDRPQMIIDASQSLDPSFCIQPASDGCAEFMFINIPPPIGNCVPELCFTASQGCGMGMGQVCIYDMGGTLIGTEPIELCFSGMGNTEIYTICRPGNGPVSINEVSLTIPELEVTCGDPDLGTYDCTNLGDIPACPTTEAEAEAAPYNMVIGDEPCGDVYVLCSDDAAPNTCAQGGQTITRTITVFDDVGDGAGGPPNGALDPGEDFVECDYTIDILEQAPPTINCPADVIVECGDPTDPAATGMATGDDDCGPVVIDFIDDFNPDCGGTGVITRTWFAVDECGFTAACEQTITIVDTTDPAISCPPDVEVFADANCNANTTPASTGMAVGSDNCGTVSVTYDDDVSSNDPCTGSSVITRTWTVTDDCGNAVDCVQTITVTDDTLPSIVCPPDAQLFADANCNADTSPGNTGMASGTDNCSAVAITFNDVVSSDDPCIGSEVITRTWTATDDCGNATNCVQVITVTDNTPPSIVCPPDVELFADANCNADTSPGNTGMATGSDNCSAVAITFSDVVSNDDPCIGSSVTTRTWTATDDCGNATNCVQVITVTDNTPPSIVCPPDVDLFADANCFADTSPGNTGMATGSDNCGTLAITFSDVVSNDDPCVGSSVTTRTWTATDDCGNATNCVQVITVTDNTPPVFELSSGCCRLAVQRGIATR